MARINEKHGGARVGAGRKPKVQEQEIQRLLKQGWPHKDRLSAIKKLATQANDGDKEAFKILSGYAFGKPKEQVEHGGQGGGPIEYRIIFEVIDGSGSNQNPDE